MKFKTTPLSRLKEGRNGEYFGQPNCPVVLPGSLENDEARTNAQRDTGKEGEEKEIDYDVDSAENGHNPTVPGSVRVEVYR